LLIAFLLVLLSEARFCHQLKRWINKKQDGQFRLDINFLQKLTTVNLFK